MTYREALALLGSARRFGMKLGLDQMRETARRLGSPETKLRFIHLAGTNGKGSTAAFCESILRAAGFRVGLYTSPHLVSVRERIQIDRVPISETEFSDGMDAVAAASDSLTFFEMMTALALWYFARAGVDWVVWETGLGGRLDATNIVTPAVSIITNIGLDHQQYLGTTIREIAAEKAGIIKPGVPVVSGAIDAKAAAVIDETAKAHQSPLIHVPSPIQRGIIADRQVAVINDEEYHLQVLGSHQAENAACAAAALTLPPFRESISPSALRRGLESATWPGRFEIVSESPLIVLDGAHNPAGMQKLVETWRQFLASRGLVPEAKVHIVFGSVGEKDVAEMTRLLRPLASEVSLVALANERGAQPRQLEKHFAGIPCTLHDSVPEMWRKLRAAPRGQLVLICGSLFLVGEVLAQRQGNTEEYRLNESLGSAPTR